MPPTRCSLLLGALALAAGLLAALLPYSPRGRATCPLGFRGHGGDARVPEGHPGVTMHTHSITVWSGGLVWTADQQAPRAEALAVDVARGSVLAVGRLQDVLREAQAASDEAMQRGRRLNIEHRSLPSGAALMPGFVEPHAHVLAAGLALGRVSLAAVRSPREFTQHIAQHAAALLQPGPSGSSSSHDSSGSGSSSDGSGSSASGSDGSGGGGGGGGLQAAPPVWLQGGGWDEQQWGGQLPHKAWLDAALPQQQQQQPMLLFRVCGHTALANSAALALAGVTRDTPDPAGGQIVRDAAGEATGILRESAIGLVARHVPPPTTVQLRAALQAAAAHALSRGVTTLTCMGRAPLTGNLSTTWDDLEAVMLPAAAAGELPLRLVAFTPLQMWRRLHAFIAAHGTAHASGRLFWGGVKEFMDGSLGSRTALMHEPYLVARDCTGSGAGAGAQAGGGAGACANDAQGQAVEQAGQGGRAAQEHGSRMIGTRELAGLIAGAHGAGLQAAVHAIGDRAVDEVAAAYALAREAGGGGEQAWAAGRHRVEHAQHVSGLQAVARLAELGLTAVANPLHFPMDLPVMRALLGPERAGPGRSFAFRSMHDAGVGLAMGSDWPVVDLEPMEGVFIAAFRRAVNGSSGSSGGNSGGGAQQHAAADPERLALEDALVAHTAGAARANRMDDYVGMLRPGMRADFIVLDRSPLGMGPEDSVPLPRVLQTYVDGACQWGCGAVSGAQ